MSDMFFSICITLKNRAEFMRGKLDELLTMQYDPKHLEICVTDGGSTDGLVQVLEKYAKKFCRIKYAISDRSRLPFRVASNNPACDVNAQICNVASFCKIIRTDAEVRFRRKDTLQIIRDCLIHDDQGMSFDCIRMNPGFDPVKHKDIRPYVDHKSRDAFFCVAFDKRHFITRGGVEEMFAHGFAGEDSFFHWWWRKHKWLIYQPAGHEVMHLDHGQVNTPAMVRLRNAVTLPLIKKLKAFQIPPNYGNTQWQRPEMIRDVRMID